MPAARRGLTVALGAVVLCAHALCAMGHVVFVRGETSDQIVDPVGTCGAMLNSFVVDRANITTSLVRNSTGTLVYVQTAEVDVDLSSFCYLEHTFRLGDETATLDDETSSLFTKWVVNAMNHPWLYANLTQLIANLPSGFYACDLGFMYWLGRSYDFDSPNMLLHLFSSRSRSTTAIGWPHGRGGAPGACPIANHPPAVQLPGASEFIPVSLTPFDTKWYTCAKGGETVSVPPGVLPILDLTPPLYPVPVVIYQSGSIPVKRGSIKTCKLVPKPALLIVTIVPSGFVFIVAVSLTCLFWSRCPVYKWRHPDEKNKKTRLPK